MNSAPRLLILVAHPDDAEIHGGGLATIYRRMERSVKIVSVTNGAAGHHDRRPEELVGIRRQEAAHAGAVIGADYETWDFPDGSLEPSLQVRARIIKEIREFKPDLVLTHRTCDYHPDHRAVGQCVQDASYMVTVPLAVPEVCALRQDPVVAYLPDLFTRPNPMRPDVIVDIENQLESAARMLACHRSQVFEWLAYHDDCLETIPDSEEGKLVWVRQWLEQYVGARAERYRQVLVERFGAERGQKIKHIEYYEISEYARQPDEEHLRRLFPVDEAG